VPPKDIVAHLRDLDPNTLITSQEVKNQRFLHKRSKIGDITPIEALVEQLQQEKWALQYSTTDDGHINLLFFAYDPAIQLARAYPEVLLIDATYRTNRYNMPLLHFMGVTPLGDSFSIAFCFIAAETET
jgi:MULE transposase domain